MPPQQRDYAVLGLDFGSICSKLCLASDDPVEGVRILRVEVNVAADHPERRASSFTTRQLGEFSSLAAWDGERLIPNRSAVTYNDYFPLKTMMAYCAGLTVKGLPSAEDLLDACESGLITRAMQEEAMREHLRFLRDQAISRAERSGLTITTIMLSYPNYLCGTPNRDFTSYREFYLGLVRPIWLEYESTRNQKLRFNTISEGQATSLYIGEPFMDMSASLDRKALMQNYADLDRTNGLTIAVADNGSSTLNFQVQTIYCDEEDRFLRGISDSLADWHEGTKGGSHMLNEMVKKIAKEQYAEAHPGGHFPGGQLPEGELAAILDRFEQKKGQLVPSSLTRNVVIGGTDGGWVLNLTPQQLVHIFDTAFGDSLRVVEDMIQKIAKQGRDFVLVFCGGSYESVYLRRVTEDLLSRLTEDLDAAGSPVRVRHAFLTNHDASWPSAVSAGAALSAMHLPDPQLTLTQSAMGLQVLERANEKAEWVETNEAKVLLARGHSPPKLDYTVDDTALFRLRLVCDPTYTAHLTPSSTSEEPTAKRRKVTPGTLSPIKISWPFKSSHTAGPYDLDWEVNGKDLPPGQLKVVMSGLEVQEIATTFDFREPSRMRYTPSPARPDEHLLDYAPISETFTCNISIYQVDSRGKRTKHALDKRYELIMVTDAGSKSPLVEHERELPVFCFKCKNLLRTVHTCAKCKYYHVCDTCNSDMKLRGHRTHGVFLQTTITAP